MATDKESGPGARVDQLVEELIGSGEVSQGQFTLAPAEARKKLREHLLADPHGYIVLLARAALARGANRLEIDTRADDLFMEFDGEPFSRGDLERMYDAALAGESADYPSGLRELGLGLVSALNLEFDRVRLIAGDGKKAVVLELNPDKEDRLLEIEKDVTRTRIHVEGTLPEWRGVRLTEKTRPEAQLVRTRLQYASAEVFLNGDPVSHGPTLESGEAVVSVEEDGIVGAAGFLPEQSKKPAVRILKNSVWVASLPLEKIKYGNYGFTAVLEAPGIRLDLSESKVVRKGTAFKTMLSAARDASKRAAAKFDSVECDARLERKVETLLKKVDRTLTRYELVTVAGMTAVAVMAVLYFYFRNLSNRPDASVLHIVTGVFLHSLLAILPTAVVSFMVVGLACPFTKKGLAQFRRLFPPGSRVRALALETSPRNVSLKKVVQAANFEDPDVDPSDF